ncbi:zinc finger, C3HC4 type [Teladorsagia circumcincta]|uniref:RING-type E3 ubiquitin transferase n=1 Tax=Teladorsagia circumcincta TaxID=45464 RepID=A0A2G9V3H0_TELCI|nr:zinc finger, C3HC4 type [Teladorsagia circumcincta]
MEPVSGEDLAEPSAKSSTEVEPSSSASKTTQSMEDSDDHHMCRVCRGEDGHLYYPCLCTGSIKYVHQECLTEWLKYRNCGKCGSNVADMAGLHNGTEQPDATPNGVVDQDLQENHAERVINAGEQDDVDVGGNDVYDNYDAEEMEVDSDGEHDQAQPNEAVERERAAPDEAVVGAYAPYKLGYFILSKVGIQQSIHYFPSIAAILTGYVAVTTLIYVLHYFVGILRLSRYLLPDLPNAEQPADGAGVQGAGGLAAEHQVGTGLYICWMLVKTGLLSLHWFHLGVHHLKEAFVNSINLALRLLVICIPIVFAIPMLMGTYFQLVVITPLRLSFQQTSLTFLWQDWAMGVLHMKIVCGAVMMGPEWWMRQAFDQIYQDGLRHLRARFILSQLVLPIILFLSSLLAFPYLIARFYIFVTNAPLEESVLVLRYCFPSSLILLLVVSFLRWQLNKIQGLAENIRNEKYLVGTRLVNYERNGLSPVPTESAISS